MSGSYSKVRNEQRMNYKGALQLKQRLIDKFDKGSTRYPATTNVMRFPESVEGYLHPDIVDDLIKKLTR